MTIIVGWISFSVLFWNMGTFINNMYMRSGIAVFLGSMCLVLYKIPVIGYIVKVATGAVIMYLWGIPLLTFVCSDFVSTNILTLSKMICFVLGTGIFTHYLFEATEYNCLETPSIYSYSFSNYIGYLKRKMYFGYSTKSMKQKKVDKTLYELQQRQEDINNEQVAMKKERDLLQREKQEIWEEHKVLRREKCEIQEEREVLQREKQKFWEEREALRREKQATQRNQEIFFFRGCKDIDSCKKRYRKLIHEYHPDEKAGDEEIFKKIQNEYEIVEKRYVV